jgi:hypothetical protein
VRQITLFQRMLLQPPLPSKATKLYPNAVQKARAGRPRQARPSGLGYRPPGTESCLARQRIGLVPPLPRPKHKLRRLAGVRARCRNPERSEGSVGWGTPLPLVQITS